jgi:hypothetical protein
MYRHKQTRQLVWTAVIGIVMVATGAVAPDGLCDHITAAREVSEAL